MNDQPTDYQSPIIVCGMGRTGTTLIKGVLNTADDLTVYSELKHGCLQATLALLDEVRELYRERSAGWRKIDDYYMYEIKFHWLLLDAFEVDAVKDGKKVKFWNARLILTCSFKVVCDYEGKWDTSEFLEKLHKNIYCEYVIKKEIIVKHTDPLYYKLLSLQKKVKDMLQMETATEF